MEQQFQIFLDKIKIEMDMQTTIITNSLLQKIEEKLQPIIEENKNLKEKIEVLENKINKLENYKKKNNLLLFRLEETEKTSLDLFNTVKEIMKNDLDILVNDSDIQNIYRIGNRNKDKSRPLLISFTNYWKKVEILKNKKRLKDVYIVEDYPKTVLEKRKLLQEQLKEERAKGKFAFIKYDSYRKRNNPNPVGLRGVDRPLPSNIPTSTQKNKNNINKIQIATINARTLRTEERLIELEEALKDIRWDILGLCEVRRSGEEIKEFNDSIFYWKGDTQGKYGIGFLVKKYLKQYIEEFNGISDRIGILNINLPGFKNSFSILQIYAPTDQAMEKEKDIFYTSLTKTMQNLNKNIIVIGDFNGQIGAKSDKEEFIIGKYGQGKRTDNGQRMINFCFEQNLRVMNTFFLKKQDRKWTWMSPNGKDRNEIDFIITNIPKIFTNVSVVSSLNFNSDHRMVRGTIACKELKLQRRKFHRTNCRHITHISEQNLHELKISLNLIEKQNTVQEKYNILEEALIKINKFKTRDKRDKTR
ncbi:unnamed protein product [Euphydryas editha]|uniref:Endonuclease/exonuclease/phosphatase domain-containing protein n=1 Tax=Euphydryas editha TaxID=104508 RepID=A0AAU9TUQ5_EUPED|nr:unnamed protein product [Euphydryas editha]